MIEILQIISLPRVFSWITNPLAKNENVNNQTQYKLFPDNIFSKSHDEVLIKDDEFCKLP